ncbi:nuclear poly(A) polymerase 3 [Senna tora]|uniref:Nuclear poly(A) polymerase 3 n=1 Tax=Senna tora TaxID=362788 RepID=A0A834X9N7_9FABA|nr:nuclear poly(A) polymerase 3 [Senna tora]
MGEIGGSGGADEGLVPSPEEEMRGKLAIQKLKLIVSSWIKNGAWNRRLKKCQISIISATVVTFGSYGFGFTVGLHESSQGGWVKLAVAEEVIRLRLMGGRCLSIFLLLSRLIKVMTD